jgi:hypothetical protein
LTRTPEGVEIIKCYDAWNHLLLETMEKDSRVKDDVKKAIDTMLPMLMQSVEEDEHPLPVAR